MWITVSTLNVNVMFIPNRFIELKSQGVVLDNVTYNVYPLFCDKIPDLDTPTHLSECMFENLSEVDELKIRIYELEKQLEDFHLFHIQKVGV